MEDRHWLLLDSLKETISVCCKNDQVRNQAFEEINELQKIIKKKSERLEIMTGMFNDTYIRNLKLAERRDELIEACEYSLKALSKMDKAIETTKIHEAINGGDE